MASRGVNSIWGSRLWRLPRYQHASPSVCLSAPRILFPTHPPGASQHPSRWRVYFCFCLFTYSCIQLFGASQGLFRSATEMQIAAAANPLSSLPCWHPTSLHVSPRLFLFTYLFNSPPPLSDVPASLRVREVSLRLPVRSGRGFRCGYRICPGPRLPVFSMT